MAPKPTCEYCEGTDFYSKEGRYYCSECDNQVRILFQHDAHADDQDVDDEDYFAPARAPKSTKRSRASKEALQHTKMSSYECYNYIMSGLVKEMIELGAKPSLKMVVKNLWINYLIKLEVFCPEDPSRPPKLQAVNNLKDAQMLYGTSEKKRKQSTISLDALSTEVNLSQASEKSISVFSSDASIGPSSSELELSSPGSSPASKKKLRSRHIFNRHTLNMLRKKQTIHYRRKQLDPTGVNVKLHCRSATYDNVRQTRGGTKFVQSAALLSPNKMYAILYLGMIINKDTIPLGRMLQFMDNHQLSFNTYAHFMPDNVLVKDQNFKHGAKRHNFTAESLRAHSGEMALFLGIKRRLVESIPYKELLNNFITDLQLPTCLVDQCYQFIKLHQMRMRFTESVIPNYEGRILSVILIVLKLLFGLDNLSELHLSTYTQILNKTNTLADSMFDVCKWLQYLEYRYVVLLKWHPPTYLRNERQSIPDRVQYGALLKEKFTSYGRDRQRRADELSERFLDHFEKTVAPETKEDRPSTVYKHLTDNYANFVHEVGTVDCAFDLAECRGGFQDLSVDHVIYPRAFIALFPYRVKEKLIRSGSDYVPEFFGNDRYLDSLKNQQRRQMQRVVLRKHRLAKSKPRPATYKELPLYSAEKEHSIFLNEPAATSENSIEVESSLNAYDVEAIKEELAAGHDLYAEHVYPIQHYWLLHRLHTDYASHEQLDQLLAKLPRPFRLALNECSRVASQTEYELIREFIDTEIFVAFQGKRNQMRREQINNSALDTFVKSHTKNW